MKIIPNFYKGKFIVFEGIDGSGKSTQVELLGAFLKSKKIKHLLTFEPTDFSKFGRKIQKILSKKDKPPKKIIEMQKLFVLDRKIHLEKQIIPALKKGIFVVCDRYFLSTFAYGMAQGLSFKKLFELHQRILGKNFILPDLIIIFDLEPEIALLRIKKSRNDYSYFEKLKKLKNIRKNYLMLAKKFPNIVILKRKSIKTDFERIKKILKKFNNLTIF